VLDPHYAYCFGCGDRHPTGLRMRVTVGEGVDVEGEFVVTGDHQGAPGLAHGGLLSAAFDEALGSLMWLLRLPAVTARLETDFVRPAAVVGRKVYTEAVGRVQSGEVALRARALFVQVGLEHFTAHGRAEELEAVRRDASLHRTSQAFEVNP
jgi:acyl-coenzyme A thioesterase PaaI-like protein